jgi:hypothetical protein
MTSVHFPQVDYSKHPAFARLVAQARTDDARISRCVQEIDEICERFSAAPEGLAAFEADLRRRFEALAGFVQTTLPEESAALAKRLMAVTEAGLRERAAYQAKKARYAAKVPADPENRRTLGRMQVGGYCTWLLPADFITELKGMLQMDIAEVRAMAHANPGGRSAKALALYQRPALRVKARLKKLGVFEVMQGYLRSQMDFYYVALELSGPQQTWYRDCYQDAGLPMARTVYVHSDADVGMLKGMLYLGEVGPQNGPFSYVEGSNTWRRSAFRYAAHRATDTLSAEDFPLRPGNLDYEMGYYRPRFKLPEQRRLLASLPRDFMGTSHFGDDLLDGTPESEQVLRHERQFLSRDANLVLFDGSLGLHRGGLVAQGERLALQIGFRVSDASDLQKARRHVAGRARAIVGGALRSLGLRRKRSS